MSQTSDSKIYKIEDFFKFTKFVWKCTGVQFVKDNYSIVSSVIKYIGYLNLNLAILGEIIYFVVNFSEFQSFLEITDVLSYISLFSLAQLKMYKMIINQKMIASLMERINSLFPSTKQNQNIHRVDIFYKRGVYGVMFPLTIFTIGAILIVVMLPVLKSTMEYYSMGIFVKRLPFLVWYPFEINSVFIYLFVFTHQGFAGFVAGMSLLASDLLLCYMAIQICMQFTGITSKLKNTATTEDIRDVKKLIQIIKHHKNIIKYA